MLLLAQVTNTKSVIATSVIVPRFKIVSWNYYCYSCYKLSGVGEGQKPGHAIGHC